MGSVLEEWSFNPRSITNLAIQTWKRHKTFTFMLLCLYQ